VAPDFVELIVFLLISIWFQPAVVHLSCLRWPITSSQYLPHQRKIAC